MHEEGDLGMRARRIVLSLAIAIGGGLAAQNTAAAEEYRGTWEQQMACTPDVWRLCSDQIPDVNRIVGCLRQNTPQLSNNCRAVFESNASAQQQQPATPRTPQQPRARAGQPQPVQPSPYDDE
jgi:hypothetical protein